MKIDVKPIAGWKEEPNLLAVGLFEGDRVSNPIMEELDPSLSEAISTAIQSGDFSGKSKQSLTLYPIAQPKRILLVGLGKQEEFNAEVAREASGLVALKVRELGASTFSTTVHGEGVKGVAIGLLAPMVEGAELALYSYTRFKTDPSSIPRDVSVMSLLVARGYSDRSILDEVEKVGAVCRSVKLARDLANTPSSRMTPSIMAGVAREIADRLPIKCKVLERDEMEKLSMGGILGVARGSTEAPKLIILEYWGAGQGSQPIALVGKGITFDSGGISIKPSARMEEMKYDKSGGAAVMAILQAVAELNLPVNVVGLVPATENLPSGSAYKPGDILTAYNRKTMEVLNTDAEGRLILSDALAYSTSYNPQAIIDLATLTGACVVALGTLAAGLMGNDDDLKSRIKDAAVVTGERVWELPLWKEHLELIKSTIADIKNVTSSSTGGQAGAIIGAAFLSHFVGDRPWAHLDIAGTAWTQEYGIERSYVPKGATGFGVRLMVEVLKGWAKPSRPSSSSSPD